MGFDVELVSGKLLDAHTEMLVVTVAAPSGKAKHGTLQTLDQGTIIDDALEGWLSAIMAREQFKAAVGSTRLVPLQNNHGVQYVLLVGVGDPEKLQLNDMRIIGAKIAQTAECQRIADVMAVLAKETLNDCVPAQRLRAILEGMILGSYRFTHYKSAKDVEPSSLKTVSFLVSGPKPQLAAAARTAQIVAESTCMARDWVNTPPCDLTPQTLIAAAKTVAKETQTELTVLTGKQLVKEHMNLLIGVGQGSIYPPAFIHLRYRPKGKATRKIALVGKGITFDTGGLDLKLNMSMFTMKDDMGGAAAVLAAFRAVALLKADVAVDAYIATAENMIGRHAQRPSDVVQSRNGKTVEIGNTDAEGRLVLADALDYAVEQKPDVVVDVATLTGAIVVALGEQCAGVFSNNEMQANLILTAAERAGELMWRMPLLRAYEAGVKSRVADLSSTGKTKAGAISAALFLKQFVGETPWAHIDIAGSAWAADTTTMCPYGGTGAATRTLIEFCLG